MTDWRAVGSVSLASSQAANSFDMSASPPSLTYPAVSVLPYSMTSGALFGSLKAALMRWARVSTGMYSTVTFVSSCAFSKSARTASTTFSLGLLLTSWNSQTRSVPLFSSLPEEELSDVWGAQAVAATTAAASSTARRGRASWSLPPGVRCNICNDGFALHNTQERRET